MSITATNHEKVMSLRRCIVRLSHDAEKSDQLCFDMAVLELIIGDLGGDRRIRTRPASLDYIEINEGGPYA